jgi:hypothetical protein
MDGKVSVERGALAYTARWRVSGNTLIVSFGADEEEAVILGMFESINDQTNRRFVVSRRERFEKIEKAALKALPNVEYDGGEWKSAKLHPDCYVAVDGSYPSRHGLGLRMHQGNQSLRPRPGERTHRHRDRHHAPLQPHPHVVLPGAVDSRAQTIDAPAADARDRTSPG